MKSVLNVEVSCFKSYLDTEPRPVNLLTWLRSTKYAEAVNELRTIEDKDRRDEIKATLPAVTVSGTFFPSRAEENIVRHSKLICIDIDPKGNEHIQNFQELKEQLFHIQNVAYAGLSASGMGFFLIIPIAYPKRHKQHFKAIKQYFNDIGLTVDSAPQNVASLRGYSFDENALFRHDAIPFRKWSDLRNPKPGHSFSLNMSATGTRARVESVIAQLEANRIDITSYEPDWFRVACAFANEFGESGRGYFHTVSQFHPKYDHSEADKKFDYALKGRYRSITIGTFFKFARQSMSGI
jgi:hypothetical protein